MKKITSFAVAVFVLLGSPLEVGGAISAPPNYWCTWITQGTTLREVQEAGKTAFAGDQGVPLQRDNLNEEVLFGEHGWATLFYPNERGALFLLLDGGWDLPYGTTTGGTKSLSMRGACIPHPNRFPSFKGTPGERLKALNDKVKSLGWRGIGVWIPAHVHGDMAEGRMLTDEEVRDVLAEKMCLCKEAGVEYWKIDWGMRSNSATFRRLMSDVRDKVYPGLILEHCWVGNPLNDVDKKHGCAQSYNGRLFGNMEWYRNRKDHFAVMEASDVFRTYDVIYPFQYVTTLERCAYYSALAEEGKLPVMLTIQERPYIIGPGLGHVLDISPSGMRNGKAVPNDACVALAWQKIAPPFGHDTELRTRYSDEVLEDVWTYSDKDCSWFTAAVGKTLKQGAPAVVTRGLPLPEVKAEGAKPFVCGARYPNGAIALAFLPRVASGKGYVECLADVTLDAKLEKGKPFGVFGRFRTLTLKGGIADAAHIKARQLPYGKARDVTALCTIAEDGSVSIPLEVFEKPQGDYTPNVVIEAVHPSGMDTVRRFDEAFADGARICFLGDSITAGAQWCKVLSDFFYTRFPDRHFAFVNAGVGGDRAKESILRLEEDVFSCKPDVVTVMFGMNDPTRYGGYVTNPTPHQVEMRNRALDEFQNVLPKLSDALSQGLPNAKMCWFTPTPYDEFARLDNPARPGLAEALGKCAEIVRRHVSARGDRICELHAPMSEYNARERREDPSFTTLCGTDRIHPEGQGGFFMAQAILKSWGAPSCVSDITIDAVSGSCTASENAVVSSVSVAKSSVSFAVLEKSLPMPVAKVAKSVADKTSFSEDLNREYLRVRNLAPGDWTLAIDGDFVMTASAAEWSDGVNISSLPTPQARQAEKVSVLNARRIAAEMRVRRLTPARHFLRGHVKNIDDWEEVGHVVKSFEGQKGFPKRLLPSYMEEWPSRGKHLDEARRLADEIYAINKPETHRYTLTHGGRVAVARNVPAAGVHIALELPPGPNNPRNSEGAFMPLKDGRIMFAYSRYYGKSRSDHATADIAARYSSDQGRTWTTNDEIIVKNEGGMNVMSVSLLRLQSGGIALFYLRKNSTKDCRPVLRRSFDEGKTWGEPTVCITDEVAYYVLNNDRVIQLRDGCLLFAVSKHSFPDGKFDNKGQVLTYASDDNGKTWKRGKSVLEVHMDGKRYAAQEPGVVELKDGRILMWIRTSAGCQYMCHSSDRGETWSEPQPSVLVAPVSPATIKRLPNGDLLAVWNDHTNHSDKADGAKKRRTPLTTAISRDDGRTWTHVRNLEDDPTGWFCYIALQPLDDGTVLLGYCAYKGLAHSRLVKVPIDWFYEK